MASASVKRITTPASAVMPHSAKNGALEATAIRPAITPSTYRRAASRLSTTTGLPASASKARENRSTRSAVVHSGIRDQTGGGGGTGSPAERPSAALTFLRTASRDIIV